MSAACAAASLVARVLKKGHTVDRVASLMRASQPGSSPGRNGRRSTVHMTEVEVLDRSRERFSFFLMFFLFSIS